jgi:hypothetical protein
MTLGEKLSPILSEIEDTLLENYETKPGFNEVLVCHTTRILLFENLCLLSCDLNKAVC